MKQGSLYMEMCSMRSKALLENRKQLKNAEQYLYETVNRGGGMESVYFSRYLEDLHRALMNEEVSPGSVNEVIEELRLQAVKFYKDYNPPNRQEGDDRHDPNPHRSLG